MLRRISAAVVPAVRAASRPVSTSAFLHNSPGPTAGEHGASRPGGAGDAIIDLLQSQAQTELPFARRSAESRQQRYHLHVFSSPNNTRLTLTNRVHEPVLVVTAGMLGYTNVRRSTYEAAHNTMLNMMDRMRARKIVPSDLEIVYKGFGQGRDAVTKCLLGLEGQWLRPKVSIVRDKTPLKYGGTRGRKQRRL